MASKFQNRLVGTVILVALSVIILPSLLDGKKQHYENEFAAIPLLPKPGEVHESYLIPPASQALPAQPPEGAAALVEQQAAAEMAARQAISQNKTQQTTSVRLPTSNAGTQRPPNNSKVAKPAEMPSKLPANTSAEAKKTAKPQPEGAPPAGRAYVVQLGALKNAAKVNEIIALLRLSGYRAYTLPTTPIQGEITRIYVGPDASKQKLQAALPELNAITGLRGELKDYSVP
ncbi:cell division protein DedD [Serratia microhaemolytica]|uniref:cell division protein DedD n=1 Tax=Serratia microhaemolytica TaxID=2675110 RepID=UPI000FDE6F59|nr:cell division protein DedD [Serratia microhaemolytica]